MSYTEQQLADLYEKAVSAEAAGEHSTDAGFALDNTMLELAPNYGGLIRSLIDQLRAAGRRPELSEPFDFDRFNDPAWFDAVASMDNIHDPHTITLAKVALELRKRLDAAQRQPERETFEEWFRKHHPYSEITMALRKDEHGNYESSFAGKLFEVYQLGVSQAPVNTGLRWDDYKAISDRAPVHEALTGFTEDATEDNAISLIRCIAEALRPRPSYWIDMHGFSSHLLHSEADAIAHCNDTGGLYVLPLYAGEPINCKLPMRMCRPALEPETIPVNRLIANIKSLPQRYAAPYVQLSEVLDIIEYLRKDQ